MTQNDLVIAVASAVTRGRTDDVRGGQLELRMSGVVDRSRSVWRCVGVGSGVMEIRTFAETDRAALRELFGRAGEGAPTESLWGHEDSEAAIYLDPYMDLVPDSLFLAVIDGALVENTRAVRFFERMGFAKHGPTPLVPGIRYGGERLHQQTMVWRP